MPHGKGPGQWRDRQLIATSFTYRWDENGQTVARTGHTVRRAELFDLLTEDGPICLTAITKLSWHETVGQVDRILFHLADGRDPGLTCQVFEIDREYLFEIVRRSEEDELARLL